MTTIRPDAPSRVLLVDPDLAVLAGLTSILNDAPNVQVIGSATNRVSALAMVDANTDAVIVVARHFPHDDGQEICRAMKACAPLTRCLLHSATSIDDHTILGSRGAIAAVLKQLNGDDLIRSIHDLASASTPDP